VDMADPFVLNLELLECSQVAPSLRCVAFDVVADSPFTDVVDVRSVGPHEFAGAFDWTASQTATFGRCGPSVYGDTQQSFKGSRNVVRDLHKSDTAP
jgi:hypothetical protein